MNTGLGGVIWVLICLSVFESGSHCIALANLELAKQARLASNTQTDLRLCLPSAATESVNQQVQPFCFQTKQLWFIFIADVYNKLF